MLTFLLILWAAPAAAVLANRVIWQLLSDEVDDDTTD